MSPVGGAEPRRPTGPPSGPVVAAGLFRAPPGLADTPCLVSARGLSGPVRPATIVLTSTALGPTLQPRNDL